jgi:hypothetical protein
VARATFFDLSAAMSTSSRSLLFSRRASSSCSLSCRVCASPLRRASASSASSSAACAVSCAAVRLAARRGPVSAARLLRRLRRRVTLGDLGSHGVFELALGLGLQRRELCARVRGRGALRCAAPRGRTLRVLQRGVAEAVGELGLGAPQLLVLAGEAVGARLGVGCVGLELLHAPAQPLHLRRQLLAAGAGAGAGADARERVRGERA